MSAARKLTDGQRELLKDAVREYAKAGCRLQRAGIKKVPIGADGKFLKNWSEVEGLTADELCDWVDDGGQAVCWILGPNHLVVDVDVHAGKESGLAAMDKLKEQGLLPDTMSIATGGGGVHFYYRVKDGISLGGKKRKHPDFPSIDFLGKGQQVLIRGSIHPSGKTYRLADASTLEVVEVEPKLLEAVKKSCLEQTNETDALDLYTKQDAAQIIKIFKTTKPPTDRHEWMGLMLAAQYVAVQSGYIAQVKDAVVAWCERGDNAGPDDISQINSVFGRTAIGEAHNSPVKSKTKIGTIIHWAKEAETWTDEDEQEHRPTGLLTTSLADVTAKHITWLWSKRIAAGRLTILAGAPGTAKSQVMMRVAALLSTGSELPDHDGRTVFQPASTLMFSLEDDAGDTMKPRAVAVNADLDKIIQVKAVQVKGESELFSIEEHIGILEDYVTLLPDIKLILIDPLNSYLTGSTQADLYNDTHVRRILQPLASFAEKSGVAIVAITHLRKNKTGKALDQVMGSTAVGGLARVVLHTMEHPEGDGMVLVGNKSNIAPTNHALHYEIETIEVDIPADDARPFETSRVNWGDSFQETADSLIEKASKPGPKTTKAQLVLAWLTENLTPGEWLDKVKVEEDLHADVAVSQGTLDRLWPKLDAQGIVERCQEHAPDGNFIASQLRLPPVDLERL